MITESFFTGTPVWIMLTMRSALGPTGGVTSVTVRPARSSPRAWTVRSSGALLTRAVGTADPRSGRRVTAMAIAALAPRISTTMATSRARRFTRSS